MNQQIAEKERAKRIILEIIRQAGGKFRNKTNLYKAFWKAHLAYAENNPGYLSEWPIVKMPNGPGIHDFDSLLGELVADHLLEIDQVAHGEWFAFVFSTDHCEEPQTQLSDAEISAIADGVEFVRGRTASSVSSDSHKLSHSWNAAQSIGDELNIYMDLLPDAEYQESRENLQRLSAAFARGLKSTT